MFKSINRITVALFTLCISLSVPMVALARAGAESMKKGAGR